ncbi:MULTISPECIES: mobile mystery protein B [Mesorhizobium]|uniref:Cell filamentation protein Fic n=1 Tax=Rhizobium loti TaxID=381 RepID=A0A6M7U4T9_RHILI|nr:MULTISPECIES: mobile mystery protein B [Mesorhizobium]KRB23418.1 cell filamentation protein Fic [Mesorhizobium sp. Root172]OBQ66762.1 cell filamentation protein Fic [Mesorhizobium loti]QKC70527.1 mobile mystery protein B [Mesorhizobium loti]QKC89501.1 mobile mystery protein B [Mesorhizobium sp. NZP2234]
MIAPDYPDGATPLDLNELAGLKHRHITTQAELDELEQANITSGLLWLSRTRRKDVLTPGFAVELHRRLFGDVWTWAGTFRTTGKNIGVDPVQIGVQLRAALDDALYWVDRDTYAPLEAAIRLHHRMVFIHPFANGNGRHARILADAMLEKLYGVGPVDWTAGADLLKMNERRAAYISALKAADRHDIGPLLAFARLTGKP